MNSFLKGTVLVMAVSLLGACAKSEIEKIELTPEQRNRVIEATLVDFDFNRDGEVNCRDNRDRRAQQFAELDKDEDKALSPNEYRFATFADQYFQFHDFRDLDTDGDRSLTFQEFAAVQHPPYLELDRDRDCVATYDEMVENAKARLAKRMGITDRRGGARFERANGQRGRPTQGQTRRPTPRPDTIIANPDTKTTERRPPTEIEELPEEEGTATGDGDTPPCDKENDEDCKPIGL